MSGWQYNFPAHRDVGGDIIEQVAKIREESAELALAYFDSECDSRLIEECLDTIHACETLLRRYPVECVKAASDAVVEKNRKRGYYSEDDSTAAPSSPSPRAARRKRGPGSVLQIG